MLAAVEAGVQRVEFRSGERPAEGSCDLAVVGSRLGRATTRVPQWIRRVVDVLDNLCGRYLGHLVEDQEHDRDDQRDDPEDESGASAYVGLRRRAERYRRGGEGEDEA